MRRELPKGFTLVELLVVIAVIGILSALLLATVSRVKSKARQAQCAHNLRQLGVGLQNFLANNHGYFTIISTINSDYPGTWLDQMERYGLGISQPDRHFMTNGVWLCPSARRPEHFPSTALWVCYGYNAFGVVAVGDRTNDLGLQGHFAGVGAYTPVAESEVANPSDMMAIGESLDGGVFFMREPELADSKTAALRHLGLANVLFCDGHVESPTLRFLFSDTSDAALVRWNRDRLPHRDRL